MSELKPHLYGVPLERAVEADHRDADNQGPADMQGRRAGDGWSPLGRQLCKRVINIDTRGDSMGAVRAYIEYGWNLNPEVGFKTTKSELNNSISVDGIDMLPAVVLVELVG